ERRAGAGLRWSPSRICGRAARTDRERAVGPGRGFCASRAAISRRLADDAAADRDGRVLRVGLEEGWLIVLRHSALRSCAMGAREAKTRNHGAAEIAARWIQGSPSGRPGMTDWRGRSGTVPSKQKPRAPKLGGGA